MQLRKKKHTWQAYLINLPLHLQSTAQVYYCNISTVRVSFTDWDGMSDTFQWVGLKNYIKLFKDKVFQLSLWNNLLFFFGTVFVQALVGVILAVQLKKKLPGSNLS